MRPNPAEEWVLPACHAAAAPLEAPLAAEPVAAEPLPPMGAVPLEGAVSLVAAVPLEASPVAAVPLEAAPVAAVPLEAAPLEAVPLEAAPLEAVHRTAFSQVPQPPACSTSLEVQEQEPASQRRFAIVAHKDEGGSLWSIRLRIDDPEGVHALAADPAP